MQMGYRLATLLGAASLLFSLAACGTRTTVESTKTDGFSGTPQRIFVTAAMPTVFPQGKGENSASLFGRRHMSNSSNTV